MRLPLCVRIDHKDNSSAASLVTDGWYPIEELEIYSGTTYCREDTEHVHFGKEQDLERCREIAGIAFTLDRLHKDDGVATMAANQFKRDCVQMQDTFKVYNHHGIKGFAIVNGHRVQMIAVDPAARGLGVGKALLRSFGGKLIAGTQSDNEAAKRLYQSVGMEHIRTLKTFHKWPA